MRGFTRSSGTNGAECLKSDPPIRAPSCLILTETIDIDGISFEPDEVRRRLNALFEAAKARDEFEFCSILLRLRGMESPGWDPFVETSRLTSDLTGLMQGPLLGHTRIRLGLLLYSHLTEVGAIYDMLANLTRVVGGERYVMDPYLQDRSKKQPFLSTPRKVKLLRGYLEEAGHNQVSELFDWFFISGLRNSFSHADYTLHEDKFRSGSDLFNVSGIQTSELDLNLVFEIFERILVFYGSFVEEHAEQRLSYRESMVVEGRLAGDKFVPIELLAHPDHGLNGFRSPPADVG